jgi:hypothetical protein
MAISKLAEATPMNLEKPAKKYRIIRQRNDACHR